MCTFLKVFSLNIQGENHFHRFINPIVDASPDIVFLQEVPRHRTKEIAGMLGMVLVRFDRMAYAPNAYAGQQREVSIWGLAMYARQGLVVLSHGSSCYFTTECSDLFHMDSKFEAENRLVQFLDVMVCGSVMRLAQTHFTWTPDGKCTSRQLFDEKRISASLTEIRPHALFGDMNAPRGMNPVWDMFAARYRDNIPANILSTLDESLHYVGHLERVVDACFTAEECRVGKIEVISGLSDHKGIYAELHVAESLES